MSQSKWLHVGLVISFALGIIALTASEALAAPANWPAKKGEVCWVAEAGSELSFVQVQVTNMGSDHYIFHGFAYRIPGGILQPLDGSAEVSGDQIIGMLTKMELNDQGGETWLESYSGLMSFDLMTLDGDVDGVITECLTPPTNPSTCNVLNTGPIALWFDDDCDPATLPSEITP